MFPYDPTIVAAVRTQPQNIADVLQIMKIIDSTCDDADGLKWFNWLYLGVTQALESRFASGGFSDPPWFSAMDVFFARFYFDAVAGALTGATCPQCWKALLSVRNQAKIARIQFAMAGMNAHINHDLPMAVVSTCQATNTVPRHGTPQYSDYTSVNVILDALIDESKQKLNLRLPGDALPEVSHLEDLIAACNLAAFREKSWDSAESLWGQPPAEIQLRMGLRDVIVCTLSRTLLVPVP